MSDALERRTVDLGDPTPARSRHAGQRSTVAVTDEVVVAGTASGDIRAYDRTTLEERWRASTERETASVVSATPFGESVAVGERSPDGVVRVYDAGTGRLRWRYAAATDVGAPQKPSRFFLPYVVGIRSHRDRLYVAARRYERDGEARSFESVVYAFEDDGDLAWTHRTDASPISLDVRDERVAVAYNRCPGEQQHGLVVLDTADGTVRYDWDPGSEGQRRVGDVSLASDGAFVASHGDYRGYRLRDGGTERWSVELATPTEVGDETLYAYPNHVHAADGEALFVTGNTYAEESRESESLHPNEHTVFGYSSDGERRWSAPTGGFAAELGADGDAVVVPGAQHFRVRDASSHGFSVFDRDDGLVTRFETDGVVTAVSRESGVTAAVEEPVVYHDDGTERGSYRLHVTGSDERVR
ncbi:Tup1 like transcriptional repressor [Halogeometricum pallidum JCM 14848]|uniref:Tup1 like transcriptional repressor n=1 Tax=Halogeometricum pallidum JCM 14848 TaxID=1227487 RepID=M0DIA8_HALPD|nr:PQQ-binding-like beta-propeller repeat protein [Halogeometricum pallidum]ELZ33914.1 Tup1 like transcriptional repressor [Halogeometricum pallidum JCM 14848]